MLYINGLSYEKLIAYNINADYFSWQTLRRDIIVEYQRLNIFITNKFTEHIKVKFINERDK